MKSKYIVLFIFLAVISFRTMSDFYNSTVVENIGNWHSTDLKSEVFFNNTSDIDTELFIASLSDIADKYDLTLIQYGFSSSDNATITYIQSENKQYMDGLLLSEGEIESLIDFEKYATNSNNKETRIYNLLFEEVIFLLPLKVDDNFSVFGPFGVYTSTGEAIDNDMFQAIKDALLEEYDELEINLLQYGQDGEHSVHNGLGAVKQSNFNESALINIFITMLFTSIMITDILKEQKKISVMKLNGASDLEVFNNVILKNIIKGYICYIIFYSIILIFNVPFGYNQVPEIYQLSFVLAGLNFIIVTVFSYILYLFVKHVPINISVKGKSFLSISSKIVVIVKYAVVFVTIPVLITTSIDVKGFANSLINARAYNTRYENLYKVNNVVIRELPEGKNQFEIISSAEFIKTYNEIREEVDAFYFISNYHGSVQNASNPQYHQFFEVDHQFLENQNILPNLEMMTANTVLINDNVTMDQEYIAFLSEIEKFYLARSTKAEQIIYKGNLENYSDLFFNDSLYIEHSPIYLLDSEYQMFNGLFNLQFYYDGTLEEAQAYLDSKFEKIGLIEPYRLSSMEELYNNFLFNSLARNYKSLLTTLLVVLIYIVVSYQHLSLSYRANMRRTYLELVDGSLIPSIIKRNGILSVFTIIMYAIVFLNLYGYLDPIFFWNILIITLIEIVLNIVFLSKIKISGGIKK